MKHSWAKKKDFSGKECVVLAIMVVKHQIPLEANIHYRRQYCAKSSML